MKLTFTLPILIFLSISTFALQLVAQDTISMGNVDSVFLVVDHGRIELRQTTSNNCRIVSANVDKTAVTCTVTKTSCVFIYEPDTWNFGNEQIAVEISQDVFVDIKTLDGVVIHKGQASAPVNISASSGRVELDTISSEGRIRQVTGTLSIQKVERGNLDYFGTNSKVKIESLQGVANITIGQATLRVSGECRYLEASDTRLNLEDTNAEITFNNSLFNCIGQFLGDIDIEEKQLTIAGNNYVREDVTLEISHHSASCSTEISGQSVEVFVKSDALGVVDLHGRYSTAIQNDGTIVYKSLQAGETGVNTIRIQ